MITIGLARELKEAGLTWLPKAGDCFASVLTPIWWLKGSKAGAEELYLLTGQPTESGYYGWSTVDTEPFCELFTHDGSRQEDNWVQLEKYFTWLPRLDQLMEEISSRTKSFKIVYETVSRETSTVSGYWLHFMSDEKEKTENEDSEEKETSPPEVFYSATAEECLGRALLSLLRNHKNEEQKAEIPENG